MSYYDDVVRSSGRVAAPPAAGGGYYDEVVLGGAGGQRGVAAGQVSAPRRGAAEAPSPPDQGSAFTRAARFVDNVVRQVAQGATFGFMDEIAAGLNTAGGLAGDYRAALAAERDRDAAFRADSPVTATAANVAGGIASPASRLRIFNPGRSGSLPGAMVRGAGAGAAAGAVAGVGEAEGGPTEWVAPAAQGAAFGAAFGGALPAAIEGARAVGGAVARRFGVGSDSADAERLLLRDLGRDGVTPGEVLDRSRAAGAAPVAVADLGGENVVGMASAVGRMPGAGREAASRLVTERGGANQADRLAGMVRGNISGDDFTSGVQTVIDRRAAQARPLYEAADAVIIEPTARLQRFLTDPDIRSGIRAGVESARREALTNDVPFDPSSIGIQFVRRVLPDGSEAEEIALASGGAPTRLFQTAKVGLDRMIESARTAGERTRARELTNLRNAMLDEVDSLNPAFREARAAFRGQSELLDAARLGSELLDMTPGAFRDVVGDLRRMSPQEREFLRLGVARGMLDRIEAATDPQELTRLNRLAGSAALRERIGLALNNEAETRRFINEFEREMRIARTNQMVSPRGNSQTMPLQERVADLRNPPGSSAVVDPERQSMLGPIVPDLIRAGTGGGLTAPLFRGAERVAEGLNQSRLERNTNELSRMLYSTDPAQREAVARALIERELRDQMLQRVINPAVRGIGRGAAIGGSLAVNE